MSDETFDQVMRRSERARREQKPDPDLPHCVILTGQTYAEIIKKYGEAPPIDATTIRMFRCMPNVIPFRRRN